MIKRVTSSLKAGEPSARQRTPSRTVRNNLEPTSRGPPTKPINSIEAKGEQANDINDDTIALKQK